MTEGGSSVIGLQNLQQGKIDVAMAMADVAYLAYAGQLDASPPFDQREPGGRHANRCTCRRKGHGREVHQRSQGLRVALGPAGTPRRSRGARARSARDPPGDVKAPGCLMWRQQTNWSMRDGSAFWTQIPRATPSWPPRRTGAARNIGGPVIEQMRTRIRTEKNDDSPATYPNQDEMCTHQASDLLLTCAQTSTKTSPAGCSKRTSRCVPARACRQISSVRPRRQSRFTPVPRATTASGSCRDEACCRRAVSRRVFVHERGGNTPAVVHAAARADDLDSSRTAQGFQTFTRRWSPEVARRSTKASSTAQRQDRHHVQPPMWPIWHMRDSSRRCRSRSINCEA